MHQDQGIPVRALARQYPHFTLPTIWRHATRDTNIFPKQRISRSGRKPKITERDERNVIRALHYANFTSKRVQVLSDMSHVNNRTVRRVLNKNGYGYRQARQKGLLTKNDLKLQLQFSRNIVKLYDEDLNRDICFYFDGKSFNHKTNPKDQARAPNALLWRKKGEGLMRGCTAKGSKAGHGGKVAHSLFINLIFCKRTVTHSFFLKKLTNSTGPYVRFNALFKTWI